LFYFFLCCFSATVLAQGTSPAPQDLPFHKDFSKLAFTHPQLILLISRLDRTAPGGSYATTGTLGADRVLVANSTAATNSGIFT
jgi:hypothetical protein